MMSVDDGWTSFPSRSSASCPDDENVVIATVIRANRLSRTTRWRDAPTETSASGFWGRRPRICFLTDFFSLWTKVTGIFHTKVRRDAYETGSNLLSQKTLSARLQRTVLKILLISDRVNRSPEILENDQKDIAEVISRYMKKDTNNMEIQDQQSATGTFDLRQISLILSNT